MPDLAAAQATVAELVERFELNPPANEAAVRIEFINPFFAALGWDVANTAGYAEQYKEVVHEDTVLVGTATKAPDYSFRIGGIRKFFVEAKRPAATLKNDPDAAYQLRRYAWSAKLPLSILTSFGELAVYDCTKRPKQTDRASMGRILYCTADEYAETLPDIYDIFARESILRGSFDRYAEKARGTAEVDKEFLKEIEGWRTVLARNIALRNTELDIDQMNEAVQKVIDRVIFLRMAEDRGIESQGRLLALTNGDGIYPRFGKLCEQADREYNSGLFDFQADDWTLNLDIDDKVLRPIIKGLYYPESPYEFSVLPADILGNVYEQFLGKVIRLTPAHRAKVEEKPEVKKAGGVYYTPRYIVDYIVEHTVGELIEGKSPRKLKDFRVLDPACGSGSFLLGAYQHLLDHYLDWYTANDPEKHKNKVYRVRKSGSRDASFSHDTDRRGDASRGTGFQPVEQGDQGQDAPDTTHGQDGRATTTTDDGARFEWRLTTAERKRILTDHIYGVDIDPQAVEVTKLSLLLKVLEGETADTLGRQMQLFRERALPNLSDNIKCGNSLIGPDYFADRLDGTIDPDELRRVNPFDWQAEFPDILGGSTPENRRGFDAVIGNPPYVRIQAMKQWAATEVEIYKEVFRSAKAGNYDIYVVFIEQGLKLANSQGRLGIICPHKFMNAQYGEAIREIIADGRHLSHVVHFGDAQVFDGATTYTCLLFLDKGGADECRYVKVNDLLAWRTERNNGGSGTEDTNPPNASGDNARPNTPTVSEAKERYDDHSKPPDKMTDNGVVPAENITSAEWNFTMSRAAPLLQRLGEMPVKLGDIAQRIAQGIRTSANNVYVLQKLSEHGNHITADSKQLKQEVVLETDVVICFLRGRDIKRFAIGDSGQVVVFPYRVVEGQAALLSEAELKQQSPKAHSYLLENKAELQRRERGRFRGKMWYQYGRAQNLDLMLSPKILVPDIADRASFALDEDGQYAFTSGYGIVLKESARESVKYVLGLLNSRLLDLYLKSVSTNLRGGFFRYFTQFLEQLPIRTIDHSDTKEKKQHDRMVGLVEAMIELQRQFRAAERERDRKLLQRQIDATDRRIDALVYELYGLTDDEIAIVEEADNA